MKNSFSKLWCKNTSSSSVKLKEPVYPLLLLHGVFAIGAGGIISIYQSQHILNISKTCSRALNQSIPPFLNGLFSPLGSQPVTRLTPIHVGPRAQLKKQPLKEESVSFQLDYHLFHIHCTVIIVCW